MNLKKQMKRFKESEFLQQFARFFLLIAIVICAFIFTSIQPLFLSKNNVMEILRTSSVVGIMALGGMIIWNTGDSDFAIGSRCSLGAAVYGCLMATHDESFLPVAVILAVLAGVASGLVTSFLVLDLKIPSFIATLGAAEIINGIVKLMTHDTTLFSSNWTPKFALMGQGFIFNLIPIPVVIFAFLAILVNLYMEHTRIGHYTFAIGANKTASIQAGVPVKRVKRIAYCIGCGLMSFAGVVLASKIKGVMLTMGTDLKMISIATTILGAAFLTLGKFNVPGVIVSAVLMCMIQNGIITCGGSFYTKNIIHGVILLIALTVIATVRPDGLPDVTFEN